MYKSAYPPPSSQTYPPPSSDIPVAAPVGSQPPSYQTAQPIGQPQPVGYGSTMPQQNPLTGYMLTNGPTSGICPHCRNTITTNVSHKNGLATWLTCGCCCIFGCWLGCCLIPFCVDGLKDTTHHCPSCQRIIGVKSRV